MKRFLLFFISMILSLAVMIIPWAFYLYGETQPKAAVPSELKASVSCSEDILLQINEKDICLAFMVISLRNNDISLCLLPPQTLSDDMGKFLTLSQIEKNGGIKYTAKSLKDTYDLNIVKYAKIDKKSLSRALDLFGSCDYEIEENVTASDGTLLFKSGRQLINGEKMLLLLLNSENIDYLEKLNLFANIASSLLNQQGSLSPKSWESLFNLFANGSESNLSIMDFMIFKETSIFKEGFTSAPKKLQGAFSVDMKTFLPQF